MGLRDVAAGAAGHCGFHRPGRCLAAIPGLFVSLALSVGPVAAHSWYDVDCCSAKDCAPIAATSVQITGDGYTVTLQPGDHPLAIKPLTAFFPHGDESLRPSMDGDWHACVIPKSNPGEWYTPGPQSEEYIRCLYVPGAGA